MSDSLVQGTGIVAGILTSGALLPQVIKMYREKHAEQISMGYLIVLLSGQSFWIVYGVMKLDNPIIGTSIFSVAVSVVMMILWARYRGK